MRPILLLSLAPVLAAQTPSPKHVTVYEQKGRFAGWPANHGAWSWGNEILVGFEAGRLQVNAQGMHAIDYASPEEHLLARSLDGGETWTIEKPEGLRPPPGVRVANVPVEDGGKAPVPCPGSLPFDSPDFIMTFRMESIHTGPSRFYASLNRGKSWQGPYVLPDFGTPGVAARTDYLIEGPNSALVFLTAAKENRREGRPFCARTRDGGGTWELVSWIGPEPAGFGIMPSSVRLSADEIVTAIRRMDGGKAWIEMYRSTDNAKTWALEGEATAARTANVGNPPSLIRLRDGRLCLTYGHREPPYGMRARLSADGGRTWQPEIVLRDDGGSRDLGYPRTVQRADGALVTMYYFNQGDASERTITATIWHAPPASEPQ